MAEKYDQQQIENALAELNASLDVAAQWQIVNEKLVKEFKFKSFIRAFGRKRHRA